MEYAARPPLKIRSLTIMIVMLLALSAGRAAMAVTVDIMLVYDTTATTWVAANGGMEAFSEEAVNRMNQAMGNSNVDLTFRLVHAMPVDYKTTSTSTASMINDLEELRKGTGVLSLVHTARETYGADLVAMLVDTGSAYGVVGSAYLLGSWFGNPREAFSVNSIRSVQISHTMSHEVGHNLGAHHSKKQTADPGPNSKLSDYSAGWYFTGKSDGQKYHTIMAYNKDGYGNTYSEAPLFSTPLLTYKDTVTGHAQDGDNSRTIRETMGVVADYRNTVVGSPEPTATATASAGPGGGVTPDSRTVEHGSAADFTVTPSTGYAHGAVGGTCPSGGFSGNTYTTGPLTQNCSVNFAFTEVPVPENTYFSDAVVIKDAFGQVFGTNIDATKEFGEPDHLGSPDNGSSVWWQWTAPFTGRMTIDTFGSGFDTVLAVYVGDSIDNLTLVRGNDNADGGLQSRVAFRVEEGMDYRIVVAGFNGAEGNITLNWELRDLPLNLPPLFLLLLDD